MNIKTKILARVCVALAAVTGCALSGARIISTHSQYYGDGPPYYGRITNMDKWQSPVADLVGTAGIFVLSFAVLVYLRTRGRSAHTVASSHC
jgi:hypothetical protein